LATSDGEFNVDVADSGCVCAEGVRRGASLSVGWGAGDEPADRRGLEGKKGEFEIETWNLTKNYHVNDIEST